MKFCCFCRSREPRPGQRDCTFCHNMLTRAWRRTHPATDEERRKSNCRAYSRMLVKRGKIAMKPCEVCGDPSVQRHHDDYSDPRNLRFLCKKHHLELHRQE